MKLKMIVLLSVAAVTLVVVGTACSRSSKASAIASSQTVAYYTCPMHPSVKADKPGDCPICGMKLQPVYGSALDTNAPPVRTNTPSAMIPGCCSPGA